MLSLAVSLGRCLPLFCAVLLSAVPCRVWCCRALLRAVLCCLLSRCAVLSGRWARCAVFMPSPRPCCPLVPLPGPLSWPDVCVLSLGAVLCCSFVLPAVWCAAVCVVSCWWCPVALSAPAGVWRCVAGCGCLVWLPAAVFLWPAWCGVFVLLPGCVACCHAVCCGLLWCPAPLCCVLWPVVFCCRAVPCRGALLSVLFRWWCWSMSLPCVCGAVLRCASCLSVPVWSVLLLAPLAVVCRCVWCRLR